MNPDSTNLAAVGIMMLFILQTNKKKNFFLNKEWIRNLCLNWRKSLVSNFEKNYINRETVTFFFFIWIIIILFFPKVF